MSICTNYNDNNSNNNYHLLNYVLGAVTGTLYNDSNKDNCQITTTYYTYVQSSCYRFMYFYSFKNHNNPVKSSYYYSSLRLKDEETETLRS